MDIVMALLIVGIAVLTSGTIGEAGTTTPVFVDKSAWSTISDAVDADTTSCRFVSFVTVVNPIAAAAAAAAAAADDAVVAASNTMDGASTMILSKSSMAGLCLWFEMNLVALVLLPCAELLVSIVASCRLFLEWCC